MQAPRAPICLSTRLSITGQLWPSSRAWRVGASRLVGAAGSLDDSEGLCDTVHLAPCPIRHHLRGCTLRTWRAGDAFRNGNGRHLFIIYCLPRDGNPMGPIKAPHSPNSRLKSAGAGPVLWRQMHLKVGEPLCAPTACHPPSRPLAKLVRDSPLIPRSVPAASLSKLWGRKAGCGGGGCFRGRKGPRRQLGND